MTEVTREQVNKAFDKLDNFVSSVERNWCDGEIKAVTDMRTYIDQLEHQHADLVVRCEQAESEVDALRKRVKVLEDAISGLLTRIDNTQPGTPIEKLQNQFDLLEAALAGGKEGVMTDLTETIKALRSGFTPEKMLRLGETMTAILDAAEKAERYEKALRSLEQETIGRLSQNAVWVNKLCNEALNPEGETE